MRARALFDRLVGMWPDVIEISDRVASPSASWWFPALGRVRGDIDATIEHSVDHWANVGLDAFYWAITRQAISVYEAGGRSIAPSSVPVEFFDESMLTFLQADGWEVEAADYESLDGGAHVV